MYSYLFSTENNNSKWVDRCVVLWNTDIHIHMQEFVRYLADILGSGYIET